jgi:Ca2+-binding EF-hand superfamily protein
MTCGTCFICGASFEDSFPSLIINVFTGASELMQLFKNLGNSVSYEKLVEVMQFYDKDESGQVT